MKRTYTEMHTNQTVDFVRKKHDKWLKFNHFQATIMEALEMLNDLVDESDPDTELPNIVHAFQTAERIRCDHPDKEWLQLVGLIHDLGKVMAFYGEPQWCVVGNTTSETCFISRYLHISRVQATPSLLAASRASPWCLWRTVSWVTPTWRTAATTPSWACTSQAAG